MAGDASARVKRTFTIEFFATWFVMVAMATIEGGIIAVFAKQTFTGAVPDAKLNLMVGLLAAMGELANILSFFWSSASQGRPKVPLLTLMLGMMVACVGLIALLPTSGASSLWMLLALVLASRICWSGYVTLRPTLWRANYPPAVRTRVVGVLSSVQVVCVAIIGASLAWVLDRHPDAYRVFLPIAASVGLVGVAIISRLRVRDEAVLLRDERETGGVGKIMKPWHGPLVVVRVLREDKWYAQFMLWMFVLGFGNLTITPTLVISLKEEFGFGHLKSVLITSTIPCVMTLLAIPFWRRLLDQGHVVRFRSLHSWTFVLGGLAYTIGAWTDHVAWYFVGAGLMGIGFGGGSLAWNIGHVDFARPSDTSKYMATHVTLNGVRGLLAPIAVALTYESFKRMQLDAHFFVQLGSLIISIVGAAGFVHLRLRMGTLTSRNNR